MIIFDKVTKLVDLLDCPWLLKIQNSQFKNAHWAIKPVDLPECPEYFFWLLTSCKKILMKLWSFCTFSECPNYFYFIWHPLRFEKFNLKWQSPWVCGSLYESLGVSESLWKFLGVPESLWESLVISEGLWESLEGSFSLWELLGASGVSWSLQKLLRVSKNLRVSKSL